MAPILPEHYPILIVDDHPTNRQILCLLLQGMGLDSQCAASGQEAVDLAAKNTYGAILMDVMMPVIDGYQATRLIRQHEFGTGQHTPIIAVTALDVAQAREQCLAAGMDDFMLKPVSRAALRDRLQRWLQMPVAHLLSDLKASIEQLGDNAPVSRERLKLLYGAEDLDDLLKVFLNATQALLAELKTAIQNHNSDEAGRFAHELKGSAFVISAQQFAQLARQLEEVAKGGDWPEALKIYMALAVSFAEMQDYLKQMQCRD